MTPEETHTAVLAAITEAEVDAREAAIAADSFVWTAGEAFPDGTADVLNEADFAVVYASGLLMAATARHIAAYNPRLVIKALAARRRILERHHAPQDWTPPPPHIAKLDLSHPECPRCSGWGLHVRWPCPDYRDAAADLLPAG